MKRKMETDTKLIQEKLDRHISHFVISKISNQDQQKINISAIMDIPNIRQQLDELKINDDDLTSKFESFQQKATGN